MLDSVLVIVCGIITAKTALVNAAHVLWQVSTAPGNINTFYLDSGGHGTGVLMTITNRMRTLFRTLSLKTMDTTEALGSSMEPSQRFTRAQERSLVKALGMELMQHVSLVILAFSVLSALQASTLGSTSVLNVRSSGFFW